MKTTTLIAVAALAATAIAFQPRDAQAYCRGCAVGAGVIGGIAAGAIIGGAIANSQNAQANAGAPVYAAPPPPGIEPADLAPGDAYGSAVCHVEKQRVWDDRGGQHWSTVEVCD